MTSADSSDQSAVRSGGGAWFWVVVAAGLGLMVAAGWWVDLPTWHRRAESLNPWLVLVMVAVLPLVGVPVTLLYVLVGARFGPGWGMVVGGLSIGVHLLASWWIGHTGLRRPLEALVRRSGRRMPRIPPGQHAGACLFVALVPGVSYTVKNYLLVLTGVPFRPFLAVCWPAHLVHAVVGVLLGDFTGEITAGKVVFLTLYALVLAWLGHRLLKGWKRRSPAPV